MSVITVEHLRERLAYHPDTGAFFWKEHPSMTKGWNAKMAGKEAGCRNDKYAFIRISGQKMYLHRVAILMATGKEPGGLVDHINGAPAACR